MASLIAPLTQPLVYEAGLRGVDANALSAKLGCEPSQLSDPERRIPIQNVFEAWELAMRQIREDRLPIDVGKHATVARFGILGYVMYTRGTVADGLSALCRYHDLINDSGRFRFEPGPETSIVYWEREGTRTLGHRVANEQVLAAGFAIAQQVLENGLPIRWVRFRHPAPRKSSGHDQHFGLKVSWEAAFDGVGIDSKVLSTPPLGRDEVVQGYFAEAAEQALRRVAKAGSWAVEVARNISELLPSGIPSVTAVAQRMNTSERTLRRRLASEKTTFERLVVEVQHQRAVELLAGPSTLSDIAFVLGFSDPTALSRAFRRWTGLSPSQWRRQREQGETT
ncbi:MAG: AraC family transcriptional regulator [Polyangiaceae bacterium]|nr:AraC family transcriptional regulator [Polyangiaceae bacterium]